MIIINWLALVWLVLGWMICGILTYGLQKNYWRQFFQKSSRVGYRLNLEGHCIYMSVLGPIGLITVVVILVVLSDGDHRFGFCFRMPKELCEPREVKK